MSYEFYRWMHLMGLFSLFLVLGTWLTPEVSLKNHSPRASTRKAQFHGLALCLILVTGFGLVSRIHANPLPTWVLGKLCIWLLLGISLPAMKRQWVSKRTATLLILTLAAIASYLAIWKPGH